MKRLTREDLVGEKARTLPFEEIEIPELGGSVIVQGMTGMDRDSFETSLIEGRGKRREVNTENIRARLAVRSLVDEPGGKRMFRDGEADLLGCIRADILHRVFNAAQKLSGVSDEDIDELGKRSKETSSDTSPSA